MMITVTCDRCGQELARQAPLDADEWRTFPERVFDGGGVGGHLVELEVKVFYYSDNTSDGTVGHLCLDCVRDLICQAFNARRCDIGRTYPSDE